MAMAPERGLDEEFELDESLARGDVSVQVRMFGSDQHNEFSVPQAVVDDRTRMCPPYRTFAYI